MAMGVAGVPRTRGDEKTGPIGLRVRLPTGAGATCATFGPENEPTVRALGLATRGPTWRTAALCRVLVLTVGPHDPHHVRPRDWPIDARWAHDVGRAKAIGRYSAIGGDVRLPGLGEGWAGERRGRGCRPGTARDGTIADP